MITRPQCGGLVLTMLALLGLPACSKTDATTSGAPATPGAEPAGHVAPESATAADPADRTGWPNEVRFGLIPVEGGADVAKRFEPLIDYLSSTLNLPVIPKPASSYNGVIVAMANQQVEIAYFGPKSYVEAARRARAEAIAMELSETGEPGYYSIMIAKSGSGIDSLEDARGRQFAFTDPNSTSGCLVPRVLFQRAVSQPPKSFFASPIKFSGSHGNSIVQVKNGHLEVAATNTLDLARAIKSGTVSAGDFTELWRSEMIPGAPMVARGDLPPSFKTAFRQALLDFAKKVEARGEMATTGYVPADDRDYDIIRYLMRIEREQSTEAADG